MADKSLTARYFLPVSLAEGVSFVLLLGVAMPLKAAFSWGEHVVFATGMVHGLLFVLYVVLALVGRAELGWNIRRSLWVLLMSVLPTGAFFAERSVKAELSRSEAAAEPVAV
jgi:integral membrane protein